jgi:xanthine dehydrogenase accessory factor
VIAALSRLAPVIDFSVKQQNSADLSALSLNEHTYILVATHGQYDEDALEQALRSPACYVAMVGSRKRAEACRAYLRSSGLTDAQIARLRIPAGLDLGAVTPEEIAASILAELVQVRRRGSTVEERGDQISMSEPSDAVPTTATGTAIDPVCGMVVEIATAMHHTTLDGRDFYFCCPACKRLFERNPQEYLVQPEK